MNVCFIRNCTSRNCLSLTINLCINLSCVREWSCYVVIVKLKTCIARLFLLGFTKNFISPYQHCTSLALWPRHAIFLCIRGYYCTGTKYYMLRDVGFIIATLTGVFFVCFGFRLYQEISSHKNTFSKVLNQFVSVT